MRASTRARQLVDARHWSWTSKRVSDRENYEKWNVSNLIISNLFMLEIECHARNEWNKMESFIVRYSHMSYVCIK